MLIRHVVDCRIGSLEINTFNPSREAKVDCRIGSLESDYDILCFLISVDCRIGSLEMLVR